MRPLLQLTRTARVMVRRTSSPASAVNLQDARPFEEIPGPKGIYNIPIIGAMFHFKPYSEFSTESDLPKLFDKLLDQYGSLVRIRLGEWTVLVEDPADVEIVFRNEGKYPERFTFLLQKLFCRKHNFQEGIAEMQGEEWHKFRNPLNPLMMRTKSAQHYLPIQNEVADDLVARLKRPLSAKELADLFYKYACESISVVCFNKRLGYMENDPEKLQTLDDIAAILSFLAESRRYPPFYLKYVPSKLKKDFFEIARRVTAKSMAYYEEAVKLIEKQQREGTLNVDKHNFMLSLMTSGKVTPDQMTSIAFSLFVAGTDSTARTLQMILYNLSRNPDKQQKLYEEIRNTMGESNLLTEQAINSMSYLPACLKESFRLIYPLSSGTQRYLPTDIVLQGYRIPAGTSVLMMNQRCIKDEKYFPNPESFQPERWLRDENKKRVSDIPAAALLPFGFGKRMCIGKRFAQQEIYLAVSKILKKYEVSLSPEEKLEVVYSPFAGPKTPLNFIFKERN